MLKVITYKIANGKKRTRTTAYNTMTEVKFRKILSNQVMKTRHCDGVDVYFVEIIHGNIAVKLQYGEIISMRYID